MPLVESRATSYEDFLKLREELDEQVELIDHAVFMTPAPTPLHQKICFKAAKIMNGYIADKNCQMLQGINIRLHDEEKRKIGDVYPIFQCFVRTRTLMLPLSRIVQLP